MSSTAAAHYGRPPAAANPYIYPPGDGYPEPGHYYTPAPQNTSVSPQNAQGAYPPPQQKPVYASGSRQSSNQYYPQQQPPDEHHPPPPQQGGVSPFYIVGQQPPPHGRASISPAPTPQHHRPSAPPGEQQPQELATSIYDTPIEPKHESSFAPPTNQGRPVSPYAAAAPPGAYNPFQYQQHPPSSEGPSPITPQNPYPSYQAYPPPQQQQRPQSYYTPQTSAEPPTGVPQDYYRQNELFLPNGARSQQ
jgi:signal transducing adaptor molecule